MKQTFRYLFTSTLNKLEGVKVILSNLKTLLTVKQLVAITLTPA